MLVQTGFPGHFINVDLVRADFNRWAIRDITAHYGWLSPVETRAVNGQLAQVMRSEEGWFTTPSSRRPGLDPGWCSWMPSAKP